MKTFKKILRFLPYWFFIPICNVLYSTFHWFPESLRQYIFYLRLPLLAVLLLFLLLPKILRSLLRNIFVMNKWQQVFLSIVSVLLAGRSIIVVINSILENAPNRFNIPVVPILAFPWDYVCSIVLAIPMIWEIISQTSREKNLSIWSKADLTTKERYEKELVSREGLFIGIFIGFLSAFIIFIADKMFLSILEIFKIPISAIIIFIIDKIFLSSLEIFKKTISTITPSSWHWFDSGHLDLGKSGYFYQQDGQWILASGHLAGLSFFLIALLLFFAVGYYFQPGRSSSPVRIEAPIIIYMMALLAIVVPLLSTMTFALDQSRFPVILTAICFLAVSYGTWQVDYYFGLEKSEEKSDKNNLGDFETAITKRLQFQDSKGEEGRTLVVITASGGGIHAAGWTAQVLAGLQDLLGADFTRSIGLISSVSGGSVGSMFFVAYCDDEGAIKPDNLTAVVQNSVQDSLDTVGWGLAYRDLGTIVGLPWLTKKLFKIKDRGEALEYSWQDSRDLNKATLNSLGEKALAGQVPIPVFNTTLVEDGRRMLFSPMTFSQGETDLTIDSNTLYAGCDIKVVTAARLSATFPYVSPTSRNPEINGMKRNYHIVDGGYFDNSGVVTAIDWLDDNMEIFLHEDKVNVKRLVFIEIEAFESQRFDKDVLGRGGFLIAFLAPIITLLQVKTASLVVRNLQEVKLLIEKYRSKLDEPNKDVAESKVQYIKIEFPNSKYAQPLSWKLTASEKFALEKAWQDIQQNSTDLRNLKRLWDGDVWKFPKT